MSASDGIFGSVDALDAASAPSLDSTPAVVTEPAPAPEPFVSQTVPPGITWGTQGNPALSMQSTYITLNDVLNLGVRNSNPNITTVTATVRILQPDGTILTQQLVVNGLTSDRIQNTASVPCSEGMLVGVAIDYNTTPAYRGQCFVNFYIQRALGASQPYTEMLIADYLTPGFKPTWPEGELHAPTDGRGVITTYTSPVPAIGGFPVLDQPANTRWRIMSVWGFLNAAAGGTTRTPYLQIQQGTAPLYIVSAPTGQAPGTAMDYSFAAGVPPLTGPTFYQVAPIPIDFYLEQTGIITMFTTNMGGSDEWTAINVQVEEWIDV